jgi:hypothetical protein
MLKLTILAIITLALTFSALLWLGTGESWWRPVGTGNAENFRAMFLLLLHLIGIPASLVLSLTAWEEGE